jgi:heme A synthase
VTIAHFVTALLFMATFIVAAVRGGALGTMSGSATEMSRKIASWALGAAATGLVVVAFGAMTANTAGAAAACTGFPLCNGQLLPQAGAVPVEIHWAHRVAAFSLFFVTLAGAWTAHRHAAPRPLRRAAVVAVVLIVLQLAVAASLVLLRLPQLLQAAHLAVGAAVWFALAAWAALSRTGSRTPLDPKGIGV